jgi:DNA-binding MarR family transcriptional regulator
VSADAARGSISRSPIRGSEGKVSHKTSYSDNQLVTDLSALLAAWQHHSAHLARALDVRPVDAAALHHLARGSLTPTELGERLGVGSGSLTGIVDRMETAGLVARHPNPSDRRSVSILLTQAGAARTREQLDGFIGRATRAAALLPSAERRIVGEFLQELTRIAEEEVPRHGSG